MQGEHRGLEKLKIVDTPERGEGMGPTHIQCVEIFASISP